MENFIISIISLIIGWLLTILTKRFDSGRDDKRKLKKLLFNLLEFRYLINKIFNSEKYLEKSLAILYERIENEMSVSVPNDQRVMIEAIVKQSFLASFIDKKKLMIVEENIDKIIDDLSEILPLLAYQLNGQQGLRNILSSLEDYFSNVESEINEVIPVEAKNFIEPFIKVDFFTQLDEGLIDISSKLGRNIKKQVKDAIERQDDESFFKEFIEGYIDNYIILMKQKINDELI